MVHRQNVGTQETANVTCAPLNMHVPLSWEQMAQKAAAVRIGPSASPADDDYDGCAVVGRNVVTDGAKQQTGESTVTA